MTDAVQKTIETALALGASGYRSVRQIEGVQRFDRSIPTTMDRDAVPSLAELMKSPEETPVLLTVDGTLWQPAEIGNRLTSSLRAIAELFGIPHDAPLDAIYQKIAVALEDQK